jgi:hypothetical protein
MRNARRRTVVIVTLGLLLGAPLLAARASSGPQKQEANCTQTLIRLEFGPSQKWLPSPEATQELLRCPWWKGSQRPELQCVREVMARHGASPDAFEFFRLTGWFLVELPHAAGPVRFARVATAWRANENEQPVLLGGTPVAVYPEDADLSAAVERDSGFQTLKARYPKLMYWGPDPALEETEQTKEGQRFVFRYRLLDGCHACPIRGWARVRFDFSRGWGTGIASAGLAADVRPLSSVFPSAIGGGSSSARALPGGVTVVFRTYALPESSRT